ncbi:MAG: 16S rRNA (uracil(1498)-N(3))-methyltransferase [Candidatus Anammoximicrobium sp.]|nr:16S rRNA (uracil(1498)-N(3))-methyltransferase [Candidatus Anammoximicrobium sp.]
MSKRFFVAEPVTGDSALLSGAEAEHVVKVLRGKVGDLVTLFDGDGAEFPARITAVGRSSVALAVLARQEVSRELKTQITLGVALPKGDRQRWLVEKAVELGVAQLVPLVTERGVAEPNEAALGRLRRYAIEAAKQCGRNRLLQIGSPQTFGEFARGANLAALRLLAHPDSTAVPVAGLAWAGPAADVWCAVGPEGGFTEEELAAADGWRRVSLGPRILRVETAAVALAAWFSLCDAIRPGP